MLTTAQVTELKDYIVHRAAVAGRDLSRYCNPAGRDVLVFGSGFGADALWAAENGAKSVLAIDLSPALSAAPFEAAMAQADFSYDAYEFRIENVHDTALTGETFDLILSNGVFEHVMDLKGVLSAFRHLLRPGGRVAIFADGLWYSSIGGHIRGEPWAHLWRSPLELRGDLTPERWEVLCNRLNRMTISDFLGAVRGVGLLILQLGLGSDPNLAELDRYLPRIRERMNVSPADLSVVSIGCELCFPEHF